MRFVPLKIFVLVLFILILFGLNLLIGSVSVPFKSVLGIIMGYKSENELWNYIVIENRLPQALTALCCGGALSASGLMLQTAFRNPLAGPGIFGINSGAALAVAVVMLFLGGSVSIETVNLSGFTAILFAACSQQCIVAYYRYHDWLFSFFGHFVAQLLCHRSGCKVVSYMGYGQLWRCFVR